MPGFTNGGAGGSTVSPANPFGGPPPIGTTTPAPSPSTVQETPPKTTKHLVSNRNSPLNLTGTLEGWAAQSAAVQLRNITLKLDDMTGAQLSSLLRKLPEGSYTLELDKAGDNAPYSRLKSKVEEIKADPRYAFMFSGMLVADTMADFLSRIFRLPGDGTPISSIDVSGVPSDST